MKAGTGQNRKAAKYNINPQEGKIQNGIGDRQVYVTKKDDELTTEQLAYTQQTGQDDWTQGRHIRAGANNQTKKHKDGK